jgi:CheY-like chemotaxis protein
MTVIEPKAPQPTPPQSPSTPTSSIPDAPTTPNSINTRYLALPPTQTSDPLERPTAPFETALPWVIEFRMVGTSTIHQVQVRETMLVGRADAERDIDPEIDLTPYNGGMLGVSRRHALIVVRETYLMIKDMGSTNGTRLNNTLLEPLKEYRLHHGDELTFGGLQIQLQFAVVPADTAKKPQTAPLTYDATIPTIGRGQRVLVIEDDDNVGQVFQKALEIAGFKCIRVSTVTQGLGVCFQQMPDAIILNMMLSDMNALDLVRYVRKQQGITRRVPVLVVSSTNGGFYKSQAYQAGADVFMGKPVAVEELVRAVGTVMV